MRQLIDDRLNALGYTSTDSDSDNFTLNFLISKEEEFVKSECGGKIPDALKFEIVDWVVAYFLRDKKAAGALTKIGDIDFTEAPLRALTEGDIRAEWAVGTKTAAERFDDLIEGLLKSKEQLALFRVIKW